MASLEDEILSASTHFGVLGLASHAFAPAAAVRRAYHSRAVRCHPDKSSHGSATAAFQRLSAAFEALYDESSQRTYAAEVESEAAARPRKRRKEEARRERAAEPPCRSWADVERDLKRREAAEEALRAAFQTAASSRFASRERAKKAARLRSICKNLDIARGVAFNALWGVSRAEAATGESIDVLTSRASRAKHAGDPRYEGLSSALEARRAAEARDDGLLFAESDAAAQASALARYLRDEHGWTDPDDSGDDDANLNDDHRDFADYDAGDW